MGYCSWEGRTAKEDWSVVATCKLGQVFRNFFKLRAVRKAGAVILCKTNVGHCLLISETVNHLWGRTLNPYNRSLTTGASSGGEAALVGFHGSPLGFGTDIGGSIRVPAASIIVSIPSSLADNQFLRSVQLTTVSWKNVDEKCR